MKLFIIVFLFSLVSLSFSTENDGKMNKAKFCDCRIENPDNVIPWLVDIRDSQNNHLCTGTIINHESILTTRFCVKEMNKEDIKVRVDLVDYLTRQKKKFYFVEQINELKPWLQLNSKQGDLVILKLTTPIKFVEGKIKPACLNLKARKKSFYNNIINRVQNNFFGEGNYGLELLMMSRYDVKYESFRSTAVVKNMDLKKFYPHILVDFFYDDFNEESGSPIQYFSGKNKLVSVEGIDTFQRFIEQKSKDISDFVHSVILLSNYKDSIEEITENDYCTADFKNLEKQTEKEALVIEDFGEPSDQEPKSIITHPKKKFRLYYSPDYDGRMNKAKSCRCEIDEIQNFLNNYYHDHIAIPWLVEINELGINHLCSGIIINHETILTTSSCVEGKNEENVEVEVGLTKYLKTSKINSYEVVDIIILKPWLQLGYNQADLAILELANPIEFVKGKIEPACLNFSAKDVSFLNVILDKMNTMFYNNRKTGMDLLMVSSYDATSKSVQKTTLINKPDLNDGGPVQFFSEKNGLVSIEGIAPIKKLELENLNGISDPLQSFISLCSYKDPIEQIIDDDYCTADFRNNKRKISSESCNQDSKRAKLMGSFLDQQ